MSCLYSRNPFVTERSLFPFRRGPSMSILWAALFLTWSMWGDQLSRLSRVTPRWVVSTNWIGFPKSVTGRGWKIIAVLLEALMVILHSLNHRWQSSWYDSRELTSGIGLRDVAMMAVCPRRRPTRRGARVRACRRHTHWRGQGRSVHREPSQPACLDKMTWPSGRMLRTSDPGVMMRLYAVCKTGNLGALVCKGGHCSRWYQRLWPRRGKLRLFAARSLER